MSMQKRVAFDSDRPMRGPKDSSPDRHRRLAVYHFLKWLFPKAKIPVPTDE